MPNDPKLVPMGRVLRTEDVGFWRSGVEYLTAARAEARNIVVAARDEANRLIVEGRRRAEREGGEMLARRQAEITRAGDEILARSEAWLADLAIDIVERVLDDRDPRENLIRAAVSAIRDFRHARALTVRAHPTVVDRVERELDERLEPNLRSLVVVRPDPDLREDRCVVASEFGTVEAGISSQLEALRAGLRGGEKERDDGSA